MTKIAFEIRHVAVKEVMKNEDFRLQPVLVFKA
jgi:hypothetical protein